MINRIYVLLFLFSGISIFAQEGMTPAQTRLYEMGFGIPQENIPSTDFTLKNLEGNQITLSDFRGKVVFLNFWATWCGPCLSEMPSMEKLYNRLKGKDFEILAVASLRGDTQKKIQDLVRREQYTFPVLIDPDGGISNRYDVQGIPTTYIIGKDGLIIARLIGAYDWSDPDVVELISSLADTR